MVKNEDSFTALNTLLATFLRESGVFAKVRSWVVYNKLRSLVKLQTGTGKEEVIISGFKPGIYLVVA